jgi:hypothetical protein
VNLLLINLRKALKARGALAFFSLQEVFDDMDTSGDRTLSVVELKNALKKLDLPVIERDVRVLFNFFDVDGSDTVDASEFVTGVRGTLTTERMAVVQVSPHVYHSCRVRVSVRVRIQVRIRRERKLWNC